MIVSGSQIRAARALAGWKRVELAQAAGLHENAVAYWERHSEIPTSPEPYGVASIRQALKQRGILVFATPTPGVRTMPRAETALNATV